MHVYTITHKILKIRLASSSAYSVKILSPLRMRIQVNMAKKGEIGIMRLCELMNEKWLIL